MCIDDIPPVCLKFTVGAAKGTNFNYRYLENET